MLKFIYWILALPLAIIITIFSLNNRSKVVLDLWPFDFINFPIPLFIIALVCILLGFLFASLIIYKQLWHLRRKLIFETRRADKAERDLLVKEECLNNLKRSAVVSKN